MKKYRDLKESCRYIKDKNFSRRFADLIDETVGLNIPDSREEGFLTAVSKVTGHSKPAVSVWFKKNRCPGRNTFAALVRFFLQYSKYKHIDPRLVESWIRYGEVATPCPFRNRSKTNNLK
ncbi:MAG: hypothetical protein ABW168_29200 [Sedimenticola sp.]